jgi:hypothetical protein
MRYPTAEESEGARAQKRRLFGLTQRALKFAKLYAENNWTITRAAREAGFSDRARGAHVRGSELMRDPRVIRAILHYGTLAIRQAGADAAEKLRHLGEDKNASCRWSYWDRHAFRRLRASIEQLEPRLQRMERIYERGLLVRLPPVSS